MPFERPAQFGTRELVTDAEFAEREAQARRQAVTDAEEFVAPRTGGRGGDGTGPPGHWLERGKPSRRTSIVIDPPNGTIPYVNDAARQRAASAVNARTTGTRPFDGPDALDLYDRCITRGLPHVIFPTIYNNTSQIVQGPGFVAIRYEMIHDARVIPIDGGPHICADDPPILRRFPRPVGGRHPRCRGHQLPHQHDQLSRGGWWSASDRAIQARRRPDRALRSDRDGSGDIRETMDGRAQPAKRSRGCQTYSIRMPRRQLRHAQHPERSTRRREGTTVN